MFSRNLFYNWVTQCGGILLSFMGNTRTNEGKGEAFPEHHTMKAYCGVEVQHHWFFDLRGEWPASRLGRFTPRERAPGTHWIEAWVGLRAGLDAVGKKKNSLLLPGIEPRPSRKSPDFISYGDSL
jgi:hypothetical protein